MWFKKKYRYACTKAAEEQYPEEYGQWNLEKVYVVTGVSRRLFSAADHIDLTLPVSTDGHGWREQHTWETRQSPAIDWTLRGPAGPGYSIPAALLCAHVLQEWGTGVETRVLSNTALGSQTASSLTITGAFCFIKGSIS